ncbi:HLH transcription factor (PalcA) [Rasamsonia emersonii CBS 393.64]|uniref:HLH transcription factor (PalcA) n=1 Tax=Rasamsonia emersonii (strain ATCC 16479 / CBS 393.64 / IMI 116815) TaxID=1408163 RepID=A0A0F4YN34_RASE3|nr:HLH transcription factor (PalcA) [Rasamsonia emersonii CBS 393.64]KKA19063.1 HLH transcription factor (PalcA) [Rasamsonia emersonii CBS 393.64]
MTMDHDASISWSEPLPEESLMSTANEDEFSNFLEFGINFPDLEGHGSAPPQHQRTMQNADNHIPASMADDSVNRMDTDPTTQPPQYASMVGDHVAMNLHDNAQAQSQAFHFSHEQQHQQHQHPAPQHEQHPHHPPKQTPQEHAANHNFSHGQHVIPPTPNSIELHGGAARYPQRVESGHDMYDRYGQMNEDQTAFYTPLVSPAMTPLETQFRMPEYTIPGEYFTPLTSPALEAQNSNPNGYSFQTTQPPSGGYVQSPVDANATSAPSSPGVLRKQRRRPSIATRTPGRAAKASPSIQPKNRRKQAVSAQLADDVAQALSQDQTGSRPTTSGASSLRYDSHESSGQDSVSPEPISEPLMPPPALPPTRKSPAMGPQITQPRTSEPATPATLMRIQNRQHMQDPSGQFSGYAGMVTSQPQDEPMEDVQLPEAVTDTRPQVPPASSSKSTPSVEPKSASEKPPSGSVTPSPHQGAMASPSGPVPKKSETKAPVSRKRQSVSSHISPALRPRISPSIQPLVRGDTGMSSETSALYLASKSNYQHILDGTVLPGVTYPETLAENLSSKRTNHKLAEQGRRNRINTALKEIESLLPPGFAQERLSQRNEAKGDGQGTPNTKNGEKEKEKSTHQTISKASTVELAIDYIKLLKKELEETKAQLKAAESKLAGKPADGADTESKTGPGTGSEADAEAEAEAKEPNATSTPVETTTA